MLVIDDPIWAIIAVSLLANFAFDVLFEIPLEYGVYFLRKGVLEEGTASESVSLEAIDPAWLHQLVDGVSIAPQSWEMLHSIYSVGMPVMQLAQP